jgi:hypothetical protein
MMKGTPGKTAKLLIGPSFTGRLSILSLKIYRSIAELLATAAASYCGPF